MMINVFKFLSSCVFFFVRPLSIIPALIGAAAAIGGGLLASHASKKNTKRTNDANLKATLETNNANIAMNKENNELQMKLARESNAISRDQFNQMMDYQKNAYTYTSQDLARAGLNPALLASGGVSATSAPSGTSVETPRVNAGSALAPNFIADSQSSSLLASGFQSASSIMSSRLSQLDSLRSAESIAANNNATQLAIASKNEKLIEAQARQASEQARQLSQTTDYNASRGISNNTSEKTKVVKEAAYEAKQVVKSAFKSADGVATTNQIDSLPPSEFKKRFPTLKSYIDELTRIDSNLTSRDKMRSVVLDYKRRSGKGK